jgi:hypothetical protein
MSRRSWRRSRRSRGRCRSTSAPAALPRPLKQTRRIRPSRRAWLTWSRQKMRLYCRRSMKVGRHRLPSRWSLPDLQPPSRSLVRWRPLSEEREHRRPLQLPLEPRASRLSCLMSQPPLRKSRPSPR